MNKKTQENEGQIVTREELIYALCRAAELEHGLTCIYLFAAYSMKSFLEEQIDEVQRDQIRNWEAVILEVAKQEMEHLGIVCNLFNAIGAPQHFRRPNLPQPSAYYGTEAFTLERFSLETMSRFMEYEKPAASSYAHAVVEGDQLVPDAINIFNHHTVQELYNAILQGFVNLDADPTVDHLFIGPQEAQLRDQDIVVGYGNLEYGITMVEVTDLDSAKKAILEIVEQGEGIDLDEPPPTSKGRRLQELYQRIVNTQQEMTELTFPIQDWQKSGQLLVAAVTLLVSTLEQARKVFEDDKDLVNLLDKASRDLRCLEKKAKAILGQGEDSKTCGPPPPPNVQLASIRQRMVRITKSDVAGIVLSGFVNPDCHYLKFWQVYEELKKAIGNGKHYDPARNVVSNPALRVHEDNAAFRQAQGNVGQMPGKDEQPLAIHIITHPYSRRVLELFNAGYETMVQMLLITFSYNNIRPQDRKLLINTAFFPFMTMVIRPMSEILTQLPAYAEHDGPGKPVDAPRAGPSFEYYIDIAFLPNREAGWIYLSERLNQMAEFSKDLVCPPREELKKYIPRKMLDNLQTQMAYLHTNLVRIAQNFKIGLEL